jgi:hypothetical protein
LSALLWISCQHLQLFYLRLLLSFMLPLLQPQPSFLKPLL